MLSVRLRGELLRVSGSAPRHAIRALLLMRGDPLLYIHLFVDLVGVTVLYIQMAVDSVGVTALYIHSDLLLSVRIPQGLKPLDCDATPVCDPSAISIIRGEWDNAAGVSGSGGVGCAISLDRVEWWKSGEKSHISEARCGAPGYVVF